MAKKNKAWTAKDYKLNAEEFVSCYGKGYCWDEFVYEYMGLFERGEAKPDPDMLLAAIRKAEDES